MESSNYWAQGRSFSRRSVLRSAALGGTGLAAAALIGCGGGSKDTKPSTAATTAPGASPAAVTVKKGGRLAIQLAVDASTFDMRTTSNVAANYPAGLAFNQLVQFDPLIGNEKPDGIIPDLATKWEIAPDGLKYTFTLVENAKFHDGTPFTAEDAKVTLESNWKPPKGLVSIKALQLEAIKSFEAPDAKTLVINLSRPMSRLSLLPILGQGLMPIYSKKDIAANFDFKTKMNGTGPYRFREYVKGNRLSFDKNKEYFVPDRPHMDGVDIFVIPDEATALANVQSGSLDIYNRLSMDNLEQLKKVMGDKATYTSGVGAYKNTGFTVNVKKAPWTDERVRLAITLATDKSAALQILDRGSGDIGGFMPPKGLWSLSPQELAAVSGYQAYNDAMLAEAKKLLAAAGVPSGTKTLILARDEAQFRDSAAFLVEQLAKVGIQAKPDVVSAAEVNTKSGKGDFDLYATGSSFAMDDPDAVFAEFYLSNSSGNVSGISDKVLDDLYLKQSVEQDQQKRIELVKEMQKRGLAQYGRVVFYWERRQAVVNKRVKNYVLHTSNLNNSRYQDVWLGA